MKLGSALDLMLRCVGLFIRRVKILGFPGRIRMYENKWTRAQPALAKRVQELVAAGHDRADIALKLRISRTWSIGCAAGRSPRAVCQWGLSVKK